QLEAVLARNEAEKAESIHNLKTVQMEFNIAEKFINNAKNIPKNLKGIVRATGAYGLGRRNRKQLYSPSYRRKDAQNKLKQYTYHLYELGFTTKALKDLEHLYESTRNNNLKKAIAWELALWHANKYTETGAEQAFEYLPQAVRGVKDKRFLRRAAIIAAECADTLNHRVSAKKILKTVMHQNHPDIYLAMANLEDSLDDRADWINKTNEYYNIATMDYTSNTFEALTAGPPPEAHERIRMVIMTERNSVFKIPTNVNTKFTGTST